MHAVQIMYTTSCKYCLVSPQHTTQKLRGVHSLVQYPSTELWTELFIPWLHPLYWLYTKGMQLIVTQITPYFTLRKPPCCRKKCAECRLMGYRVRYPTHRPHPAHCVFHGQHVHVA
jgi:hypothetical protein